jgi:hypothetical protein
MPTSVRLPDIPDAERTALVEQLVVLIETPAQDNLRQVEAIQQLRAGDRSAQGREGKAAMQAQRDGRQARSRCAGQRHGRGTGETAGLGQAAQNGAADEPRGVCDPAQGAAARGLALQGLS